MDEKVVSLMQDARLINSCEQVLYPMINNLRVQALARIINKSKAGDNNITHDAAYLAALADIESHLQSLQRRGMAEYAKLNQE